MEKVLTDMEDLMKEIVELLKPKVKSAHEGELAPNTMDNRAKSFHSLSRSALRLYVNDSIKISKDHSPDILAEIFLFNAVSVHFTLEQLTEKT